MADNRAALSYIMTGSVRIALDLHHQMHLLRLALFNGLRILRFQRNYHTRKQ